MDSKELLIYDVEEAVKFIAERTDIDPDVVVAVLDAEDEYMRKVGIIKD